MNPCATCGRDNDASARYCIDCGKPLVSNSAITHTDEHAAHRPGAAGTARPPLDTDPAFAAPARAPRSAVCDWCGSAIDPSLPFCASCGRRTTGDDIALSTCPRCGAKVRHDVDLFCASCGAEQPKQQATRVLSAGLRDLAARVAILDQRGEPKRVIALEKSDTTIGRGQSDIRVEGDLYLSPVHALLTWRDGKLVVRDLGSRNRTWVFISGPTTLADDDVILVGSQLLRFRRLGYPGGQPPDADGTRGIGSLTPTPDVALLEQLRSDGSVRDTLHLALGRSVVIGRDRGDWLFGYDQTMSSRHAEVKEEGGEFIVLDSGSRNGVGLAVRGERALKAGDRVLAGDQLLRVERV
ncbi:MAG TPA: FHA domain-containing protein [Gemmatimonadaceae bacterium]|nr:FHA domain-containing protein [Gemmatimonadaceae bacterium]